MIPRSARILLILVAGVFSFVASYLYTSSEKPQGVFATATGEKGPDAPQCTAETPAEKSPFTAGCGGYLE